MRCTSFLKDVKRFAAAMTVVALCSLTLVGCNSKTADTPDDVTQDVAEQSAPEFPKFSTEIRSLSDSQLKALGEKNSIPTEFVYPNSYYVQVVYPDRLAQIENGASAISYVENNTFQIPTPGLLEKAEYAIFSRGFSFEPLKDAKSGATIQEGFPSTVEIVYLKMKESLDQKTIREDLFKNAESSKVKQMTFGKYEATIFENSIVMPLDQSGQNLGKIENVYAGLCFPSEDSVAFLTGAQSAIEAYLSDKPGDERGIAAQRLARIPADNASMLFQYDCDFDFPNAQLVQFPIRLTPELSEAIQKTVSSFQFIFDPATPDGSLLTLNVNVKSESGASDLRKAIGSTLMQTVDAITTQKKDAATDSASILDGVVDILKSVQITAESDKVVGVIKNTPENQKFISDSVKQLNDFRESSEIRAKYQIAEQALMQFGAVFTRYSRENKVFPAAITADDGTPLLSWRVAILPILGEQYKELYNQFKLDEPWNSDANIKLLDKMPPIFAASSENASTNKTQYLVFNSPETPFGRSPKGLKLQDVEDPYGALSVVFASPANAVEWTKPETFVFNPSKPSESFGEYVCAVTLMNELISAPCDDTEKTAKSLAALVFGVSQDNEADAAESETAAPAEAASEPAAEEAAPAAEAE